LHEIKHDRYRLIVQRETHMPCGTLDALIPTIWPSSLRYVIMIAAFSAAMDPGSVPVV